MDWNLIEEFAKKFVRENSSRDDYEYEQREVVNQIYVFLSEYGITEIAEIDEELSAELTKHLRKVLSFGWRIKSIQDIILRSGGTTATEMSEDEKLSFQVYVDSFAESEVFKDELEYIYRRANINFAGNSAKFEVEKASSNFESSIGLLNELLPPLLFEAFVNILKMNAELRFTAGFSEASLKVLARRALLRVRWQSE
ncbi:MAG: hypothetical protein WA584_09880 [Pyrinomonadaceae bacterium]